MGITLRSASAALIGCAGGFAVLVMQRKGYIREQGLLGSERPDIREKCLDGAPPDDPRRGLEVTVNRWWYFGLMVKDMGFLIGKYFYRLLRSLDLISEEEKARFLGSGPAEIYKFGDRDFEPERFSPDKDWMPRRKTTDISGP